MEQSKEDYEFYKNLLSNIDNEYDSAYDKKGGKNKTIRRKNRYN